jgi:ATP adenylyltransferase/5',5'''-P-1,P-4-tetraphosphate phosphorylase II
MPNRMTDRYNVTQKYLMTRGQAINFPAEYFENFSKLKKNDVFGVVIDIPMSADVLTTMVCFINGAANIYFNNGGEYTGASQKYRNLVQAAHTLVANAGQLIPKCEKTKRYDLPKGRTNKIFLLTKSGVYMTELKSGLIPETEPELRSFYVLYQRVLSEIRSCQLKDEADRRNAAK